MHRDRTFQIKTYNDYHSCKGWNHRNKTITSSYIARRYLDDISKHKDWNVKEFRDHVSVELRAHVTLHQCRRAKQKARKIIYGDLNTQYKVMWNYCNEIERTNPNTSIYMKLVENEVPNKPNRFQRIYIFFGGCKEGFKSDCRRIVGVDGCWLKGPICRKWDLTGIPCKDAIAAIWDKKDKINFYVHDCYKMKTYRRVYDFAILPMNGQHMWPKSSNVPHLPPQLVRTSTKGRKQKLRRKEPDEVGASRTKMKRKQNSLLCSLYHNAGHNKRTCKFNIVQQDSHVDEPSSYAPASSTRAKLPVSIIYN
ncbi:uncharacterized protein [Nicotiana tomentosiformis]|uniref:uncharacterized protein n=1 Tax=Nicotiana tomentosiformis TaxID=4098 RepID=UPI00388CCE0A